TFLLSARAKNAVVPDIRRELDIVREVHLHTVALPNRDGRQSIQEPIHHLQRGLRRSVAYATGDDDGAIAFAVGEAGAAEVLRQAAHQTDRRRRTEGRQIVLVDAIAESRVADLVQPDELIEPERAAVRHHQ